MAPTEKLAAIREFAGGLVLGTHTQHSRLRGGDLAKFTELGRYWIRLGARCFITG